MINQTQIEVVTCFVVLAIVLAFLICEIIKKFYLIYLILDEILSFSRDQKNNGQNSSNANLPPGSQDDDLTNLPPGSQDDDLTNLPPGSQDDDDDLSNDDRSYPFFNRVFNRVFDRDPDDIFNVKKKKKPSLLEKYKHLKDFDKYIEDLEKDIERLNYEEFCKKYFEYYEKYYKEKLYPRDQEFFPPEDNDNLNYNTEDNDNLNYNTEDNDNLNYNPEDYKEVLIYSRDHYQDLSDEEYYFLENEIRKSRIKYRKPLHRKNTELDTDSEESNKIRKKENNKFRKEDDSEELDPDKKEKKKGSRKVRKAEDNRELDPSLNKNLDSDNSEGQHLVDHSEYREIGDSSGEIGDSSGEIGDSSGELGDSSGEIGDKGGGYNSGGGDNGGGNLDEEDNEPPKLWILCDNCYGLNYKMDFFELRLNICEYCDWHLKLPSSKRITLLLDPGTWHSLFEDLSSTDPINWDVEEEREESEYFCDWENIENLYIEEETEQETEQEEYTYVDPDEESYTSRIDSSQRKTGLTEAVQTGVGLLRGIPVALGTMEFEFIGGSMGSVVGEKITRLVEYAFNEALPLLIVCASGGARMQEGSYSLMQMAKIASTLRKYQIQKKLLYISILTTPTTGGVTASFGMLGNIVIAEPNAYIAFAGKRVIEQTLNKEVPEGLQETENLFHKGLIDSIVPRYLLKEVLFGLLELHGFLYCRDFKLKITITLSESSNPQKTDKNDV
uniref:Acetyl-coenzyme A carboxylase carboxyl transferase subunit beta, chloroplastic n=1 Tax=Zantedeschia aethiopica TaxID=69721 RepID=A0A6B9TZV8_ZANAE|nr:acetyl-CoA carboxylase beta subunit [Zantedeschia aethiopica]